MDEALIELAPYEEHLEVGDTARFEATLKEGFQFSFCAVTRPDGKVAYVRTARIEGRTVVVEFPLDLGAGRYQVEYVVTGEFGNQVAANIDVFAGEGASTPDRPVDEFAGEQADGELARELFDLTNRFRVEHGLRPLPWDPLLAEIGEEHAEACGDARRLAHVLPDHGGSVADRARRKLGWDVRYGLPGFPARRRAGGPIILGDNLAVCANPELALFLLAESPGHRAALLNPHVDAVGIGAHRTVRRRPGVVEQGIWFCMVFAQFNDLEVLAQVQRRRRLELAEDGPGGQHLARARRLEAKGKTAQALTHYRRFLALQPGTDAAAAVRTRVDELVANSGDEILAEAREREERTCRGHLQLARNFLKNDRREKAIERLEKVLELCPDGELADEAYALLGELGETR